MLFTILTNDISRDIISLYDITKGDTKSLVNTKLNRYLPLTEAAYYILLSLREPLHGYGVMLKVEKMSRGAISIGPGTLYGAFATLEREKLIAFVREDERRRVYQITEKGEQVLDLYIERLGMMLSNAGKLN